MASGSPRTRIDQFYASKKRKHISPKSDRNEEDAKTTEDVFIGAKTTLDNYSVTTSLDKIYKETTPFAPPHSLVGEENVRRSLSGEIIGPVKNELNEFHVQPSATTEEKQHGKFEGISDEGSIIIGDVSNKCSVNKCAGNPKLKQFAADFLSLYCRGEFQANVTSALEQSGTDHKRHCSPFMPAEEVRTYKKRFVHTNQLHGDSRTSSIFEKTASYVPVELKEGLKKCKKATKSSATTSECQTPGSSTVKASSRQTTNSTGGVSLFSPGEAFWNEAIEVADGLYGPTVNISAIVGEDTLALQHQHGIKSCCSLENGHSDDKVKIIRDECASNTQVKGVGPSAVFLGKDIREMNNDKSPLPVKHFDFSGDGKTLDKSIPLSCDSNFIEVLSHRGNESSEHDFVQNKSSLETSVKIGSSKFGTNENNVKLIPPVPGVTIRQCNVAGQLDELKDLHSNQDPGGSQTPSSFVGAADRLDLSIWLPSEICSTYRKKGITKLYPWQVECLLVDGVLKKRNLVYCASTSAGKTIVAEILMLRQVITTRKIALLVLPYVSICAEKAEYLELLLGPLNKHVRSYYGNQGGGMLPKDTAVAVCTIEKANSLINKLLEEGRLSEIGIIVIDELHMVGDQNRGYLLELLLTKLLYAAGEGNSESSTGESSGSSSGKHDPANGLQIVGMSATMPNVAAVADWLQAALYQTDFRPVPLEEYIKVGNVIYSKKMAVVRTISKTADIGGKDPDHVIELCNEVVQEGHSVLIFCSSRKGCESTARHVSKFIKKFSTNVVNGNSEIVDLASAIDALRRSPSGLDPILEETLPLGVAYHHAGLTVEEKEVVETCYRRGLIRILTATSTLAAGVNLPARRVIFRQPRIGRDFIDGTRYRQMAGRAGRTGIDSKGESILICKPEEIKRINVLVNENCPPLHSCLSEDKNGMIHAILEVVASGIVQTTSDIHRYVKCTLLNSTKPFQDVVKSAQESLRWLCYKKFLEWNEETKLYSTTPLGRAAFGSSLNPEESLVVLDDLLRAREGFVLASDLHVVYLVTPVNVEVEPNWELYYKQFMELSTLDQSVGNRVGVAEPFLMRMAHGAPMCSSKNSTRRVRWFNGKGKNQHVFISNTNLSEEQSLRVCKRFYVALILSRLIQEAPVRDVCEAFKVARGMVQALQETAGRFAAMVCVFCERLGWNDLEGLVVKFQNRVAFGVRAEIVELTTIPYVKGSRARALYKAGLRTLLSIAEASIADIVKALFESSSWSAQESSAKKGIQIGMAKKIKHGARKLVLEKAEEARIAAFSAFKSLGLDVRQIPVRTSPLSIGSSSYVESVPVVEPILGKPSAEERRCSKVVLESEEGIKEASNIERSNSEDMTIIDTRHDVRVQNCQLTVDNSLVFTAGVGFASYANTSVSDILGKQSDGNHINVSSFDNEREGQCSNKTLYPADRDGNSVTGPINASSAPGGFDAFLDIWDMSQEFYFDIHYNQRSGMNSITLFEIRGMAICWKDSPVYYINLPKDLLLSERQSNDHTTRNVLIDKDSASTSENMLNIFELRWNRIKEIMGKRNVLKFTWNLKVQIHALKNPSVANQRLGCLNSAKKKGVGLELLNGLYCMLSPVYVRQGVDLCVVAWILWPDDERSSNPNLEKEVKKRLSKDAAAVANRSGQWKNQMKRASHNGCCRRVAQTRALCSVLWKLVISEELVEALMNVEVPLVNVLADMEHYGIGVDMEGCLQARRILGRKLRCLETEAYKLAGMTFSLYTAADIANVLYGHLKLCIPEGVHKGKVHPSTDKHCLDLLRHQHPIVPVIKEHRTLAKLFNCTLGSICSLARLSPMSQKYTLHGHWLQTSTATGRLSIEEPNLQCVEHMVDFKIANDNNGGGISHYKINARDFFVPTQDNWLLVTADYSQIELRLMAHFSKDSSLIELLNRPGGDIFTMIAARWTGKPEILVGSEERNQTKGLVYGMLYGMGSKTLSEQLECSIDEAAEKIQNFKSSFPGVTSWLHRAIDSCRDMGHVTTLNGRKRFLPKIKFGNKNEKSKAQRQVANSICQGSAADIIKIAMVNLYSVIDGECDVPDCISSHVTKFHMLRNQCRILLQVHDELVLEVHPSVVKEAALLLQICMENAASLLVPLQVKVKVGRSWGSLEPYAAEG